MKSETLAKETVEDLFRSVFGSHARLRPGQWEAIAKLIEPGARHLVIESTGWGKSAVYFAAARFLKGVTLVISPLLALMRNQLELASKFGLRAVTINSSNHEEWNEIFDRINRSEIDLIFISPERLGNEEFRERVLANIFPKLSLLVIDEAHCVSDWGHDFRPDYQRIVSLITDIPARSSLLATTATANERVILDLQRQFEGKLTLQRGKLLRESLYLSAHELRSAAERMAYLAQTIPQLPGSGIVYVRTIGDTQLISDWLNQNDISATAYHGQLDPESRIVREQQFFNNEIKVLVATSALGMGYDKPDIGFVVHYQTPGSPIAYYQQVGRAGRAISQAYGVLLLGEEDADIEEYFITAASPPAELFHRLLDILQKQTLTEAELVRETRARESVVKQALRSLSARGFVVQNERVFSIVRTPAPEDFAHIEAIRAQRRDEFSQMEQYVHSSVCRMQQLGILLGELDMPACGKCDRCVPAEKLSLNPILLQSANDFLVNRWYEIEPRKMTPAIDRHTGAKRIPRDQLCERGFALSAYNTPGLGREVRSGKYQHGELSASAVELALRIIKLHGIEVGAIVCVPSSTNQKMIQDFSAHLAVALNIPVRDIVKKSVVNLPQKQMQSSAEQFENVWEAFSVEGQHEGSVLLLDDIVDSGWTLTAIGRKLRIAGFDQVFPMVLAIARSRGTN